MAFTRPTLAELVDRVQQDFVSRLELTGAVLRRSLVYVLSRVLAGAAHMLYGYLDWLAKQLFADTSERAFLLRQASLYGLQPTAADFAQATLALTGEDGSTVPAGSILLRSDGAEYVTLADAEIGSLVPGEAEVSVVANLAGAAYTLTPGVVLTFQSPVSGVATTATVSTSDQDGVDEESTENFRTRFLERLQQAPQGGADNDYVAWAKEVPGVTRVWVDPLALGVGTVVVRFVRDGDASLIPDAGEVAAVQAYIDEVRPVTAAVTVLAPVEASLDLTISVEPDTVAVRAAVEAELTDLLERVAEPGGAVLVSQLRTAIGTAEGVTDYTLVSPVADVAHTAGELPTLGVVTWA
jgi:uncharacterized phage protein gp47/JayE